MSHVYIYFCQGINSLPNYKILDMIKLKAFADEKLNVSIFDREANTIGKGENAGYQHFLLFLVFSKAFFFKFVKSRDCVVKS